MHLTYETILSLITAHKYAVLFPLMVVEGPIISIIAGFLASPGQGYLNIWPLFITVVTSDLTGDLFYYALGRWGRNSVVFNWARRLGLSEHRFLKLKKHFDNHGGKTIIIGKFGHGIGWVTMLAAGVTGMNLLKFLSINFFVSLVKSALLIAVGYYYGRSYEVISTYFHYGGLIFSLILLSALIGFLYFRRNRQQEI